MNSASSPLEDLGGDGEGGEMVLQCCAGRRRRTREEALYVDKETLNPLMPCAITYLALSNLVSGGVF